MTQTLIVNATVILTAMLVLWLISLVRRDASIVDAFWGVGFVIGAWVAWCLNSPASARIFILAILTSVWGLRLSLFLLRRNLGHGEDSRYSVMRTYHGNRFWWISLFTVFLLQGGIMWFVSLPIQVAVALNSPASISGLDAAGITLWAIGFFFETVGDWQLAKFKANPSNAGRIMDCGLWRFTRHPNYFGDFCVWWGVYLIAAAGAAGWTIASPLVMTLLLMRISGVTLLERGIVKRRPEYAKYQARTNAFFPGPRRGS